MKQKTALAIQLFGKSGAELIPFLNQGRDGINELSAEMQALGVQMSGETAAQAGEFNDALDKLKLASTSIGNQIIASLLPALNDMAGGMVESAKQGGTLRVILDGVVLVLKTLALGAATVGKAFVALGEAIGAGVAAAVEALKGNTDGAKAIIADLKGSLIKRLDELASFRDSLFDPKPIEVKAPKIQADPELLQRMTRPRAARAAPDTTGAQTSLIKAQLDAELALLKDALTRQQTVLDAALEDRLISVRDYHAQKTAIIGDIHGHADALEALLTDLGYRNTGGAWRHPARLALFVGDLVDRGPKQMETVSLVRRMVDAGSARAVMGNHEFNAIAWFLPDPECPGEFLRKHHSAKYGDKNRKQHQAFLSAVEGSPLHEELVTWFLTLPVCLDLPDLRVIHACWHVAALD